MKVQACNLLSTWETETRGSKSSKSDMMSCICHPCKVEARAPGAKVLLWLNSEFKASLSHMGPYLKKKKTVLGYMRSCQREQKSKEKK